jgi:transposase
MLSCTQIRRGTEMPQPKYDFSEENGREVYKLMRTSKDVEQFKRMQAVYYRACYKEKAPKIAERTGLSIGTIWNIHSRWKRQGISIFDIKATGGRLREYIPFEEEKEFLKQFETEGNKGGILEVKIIHEAYKTMIGEDIALSTTYRMLDRHGWRKIMPRPRHPKGDLEAQTTFKKTGQN